ncbi:hypothetical protein ACF3NF_07835 (plasmid) [Anaerococcus martiniensis]|uniref:hypothetical protein n=1 Tax=Anaerococcus sp. WGS1579 TaxID=3366809 RepID=UPI00372D2412
MNIKNKYISFGWFASYVYVPTFIFLISRIFIKEFDIVFSALFFTVVTISSLAAYYMTNKSLDKIKADKLIAQTIPLSFVFMIILAILVNVLI